MEEVEDTRPSTAPAAAVVGLEAVGHPVAAVVMVEDQLLFITSLTILIIPNIAAIRCLDGRSRTSTRTQKNQWHVPIYLPKEN